VSYQTGEGQVRITGAQPWSLSWVYIQYNTDTTIISRRMGVAMKFTLGVTALLSICISLAHAQTESDETEAAGGLSHQMTVAVHGDYVAAGTGLQGVEQASIVIDTIPEGAKIAGGVLYWGLLDTESRAEHARISINGIPVRGRLTASTGGCWRQTRSFAYRVKLSREQLGRKFEQVGENPLPPPPGNGNDTYVLSGFASNESTVPQGATLVLVYEHEAARAREIVFFDGNVAPSAFPPPPYFRDAHVEINGFLAQAPVEAASTYIVGNGAADVTDLLYFTTEDGTFRFVGFSPLDSSDGMTWDTETVNLDGAIADGDTSGTASLRSYAVRVGRLFGVDCTFWAAQITSVTTSRPVDPDPGLHFEERTLLARLHSASGSSSANTSR
jgi:hypothetical protein